MPAARSSASAWPTRSSGPVPFKLHGRVGSDERESRYQVEADLQGQQDHRTAARLVESRRQRRQGHLHGDRQAAGDALRRHRDRRAGHAGKGMIELDANGEIIARELPDLRALRRRQGDACAPTARPTARCKVTMRGELFDGRGFIKSTTSGRRRADKSQASAATSISTSSSATVTGYNGEALRGVELRMSRRNGHHPHLRHDRQARQRCAR